MRLRPRLIGISAATGLALSMCGFVGSTGAAAATLSGVPLTSGPSSQGQWTDILAASSAGVLYRTQDAAGENPVGYYLLPAGGDPVVIPTDATATYSGPEYNAITGDFLSRYDLGASALYYSTVADAVSGLPAKSESVDTATFIATGYDGYFTKSQPGDGTTHVIENEIGGGTVDLGAVPGDPGFIQVEAVSAQGVLLGVHASPDGPLPVDLYYVAYDDPSNYVLLKREANIIGGAELDATGASWLENPQAYVDETLDPNAYTVMRTTLDGAPVLDLANQSNVDGVAMTPDYTAILTSSANGLTFTLTLHRVADDVTTTAVAFSESAYSPHTLFGAGNDIVFTRGGDPQTAGVYQTDPATGTTTELVAAGPDGLRANGIAASAGRVAWMDNGVGAGVWQRSFAGTGNPPTLGPSAVVAADAAPGAVSTSGDRTAYFAHNGATNDFQYDLDVAQPGKPLWTIDTVGYPGTLTLSGNRLLDVEVTGAATLYDLTAGTSTSLPGFTTQAGYAAGGTPYALWGDELASIHADGSVWVTNLVTNTSTELSGPVVSGSGHPSGVVAISSKYVAWLVSDCEPQSGGVVYCLDNKPVQYVNWHLPATAPGQIANDYTGLMALDGANIAYAVNGTGVSQTLTVEDLVTADTTTISGVQRYMASGQPFAIAGNAVAWVGTDGLPYAAVLPSGDTQPTYLGDGVTPSSLVGDGAHTWDADFTASQPLTDCVVTIAAGATTVRTLPCDGTQTPYGEAQVGWDGRDSDGNLVSPGTYRWTLTAGNSSGPLLNTDGGSGPITGTIAVTAAGSTGGAGGAGGGTAGDGAPGQVTPGGSVWSGGTPTESDPISVGVTSPVAGTVTITPVTTTAIPHPADRAVELLRITAPEASVDQPLKLTFEVYLPGLPAGSYADDLRIFRNGASIPACASPNATTATPDPCVTASKVDGDVATFEVLSTHASTWQLETADLGRLAGADRFQTAAATSRAAFPGGGAGAVVLARSDDYADALVGAPLAAAKNAPLLLTTGTQLPAATKQELQRVLPAGGTVYLLGSDAAIPSSIESELTTLGYNVVRLGGADRFATAVKVADALGDPSTVLLATGTNYPDALAAGPAAAHVGGAVLLTNGGAMPPETTAYLKAHATTTYAIGGPAVHADPGAQAVEGADRYATAADVATTFFRSATIAGVATGENFPDALAAGPLLARADAPLVLTAGSFLPTATSDYLSGLGSALVQVHVFGGTPSVSAVVESSLSTLLGG